MINIDDEQALHDKYMLYYMAENYRLKSYALYYVYVFS